MITINNKIKGIIFDLDGVITDTSEYHYLAWKKLADKLEIPFNREKNEQFRGVSRMDCLEILLAGKDYSAEEKRELADEKNSYYREYLQKLTAKNILPGALELIEKVKDRDIKIAIASSSKNTDTVVSNLGIKNKFAVIADGFSVARSKPEPDIFIYTAEKMRLLPEECIVIEDAESGIEAALAANMVAIGIGPAERVGKAHFRFARVADIDIDRVLSFNR